MFFDTEYSVDRLLQEQPSLGRFAGEDRRVSFPLEGQTRRTIRRGLGRLPPTPAQLIFQLLNMSHFCRSLSNTIFSALAFCALDGGLTIQVSFLPAPSADRVGFALLTPLSWRPVQRNLDDHPPMTQVA
jgi:hypothetical protein